MAETACCLQHWVYSNVHVLGTGPGRQLCTLGRTSASATVALSIQFVCLLGADGTLVTGPQTVAQLITMP